MQNSKLYVGNLDYSVTRANLEELFTTYGEVRSVNVIEYKGFAFVEMSSVAEAQKAREALNGTEYKNRTIRVDEAKPQKDTRGSRPPRRY
jgi:RNA recognition motif-containing protein